MSIRFNQVGYRPSDVKKVVFAGDDEIKAFSVYKESGEKVFEAGVSSKAYYKAGDENICVGDFSALNEKGVYYLMDSNGNKTETFRIAEDVYEEAKNLSLKMFRIHRCGCEVTKEEAGEFFHKSCHDTKARIYGTDEFIDVNGGWHDAGDYGRYIVAAAKAVVDLLMAYDYRIKRNPSDVFAKKLIDEAIYEIKWMMKMQNSENGGVYHKVTCASFPGFVIPEEEREELIISPISYAATADFAATMAYAYRVYSNVPEYKELADTFMPAALKAINYMENNPVELFKNPEGIVTGEYGDVDINDEKFWAYAEMYKTTGDRKYEEVLLSMNLDEVQGLFEWKEVGEYGFYAYVTAKEHSDKEFYNRVYKRLTDHVASIKESMEKDPYSYSMDGRFYWGCNMGVANDAMLLLLYDDMQEANGNIEGAELLLSHIFGMNANGVCYLTGVGSNPAKHPHHRPSVVLGKPMPGMLVGGPEPLLLDDYMKANFQGVAPAKCYADHHDSYSSNEITIYWNSPLVFVLSALA